jgi:polysaccharide biosynthesis protein PslH
MKILFISEYFPFPLDSGSKARIWYFIQGLAKSHKVFLLTFDRGATPKFIEQVEKYCEVYLCRTSAPLNPTTKLLNLFSFTPLGVWRRKSKEFSAAVRKVIEEQSIDCIFVVEIWMAQYAFDLPVYRVIDKHNIEFVRAERRLNVLANTAYWKEFLFTLYYSVIARRLKRYELKMLGQFQNIIVCSDHDARLLQGLISNGCVTTVDNGVDLDYFHPETQTLSSKIIVFTGSMFYEPNVDAVLYFSKEILPLIKVEFPDIKFYIVGNAPSDEIQQLAKDISIVVTGYVDDIRPYVWGASVVVVPLRMGSGTRLKILEAMAMHKPVVSTSIGCEGLWVEHEKDILISDSPSEFAQAVIRVLTEPDLAYRLADNGRKLVSERYSWITIQQTLTDLVNAVGVS